MVRQTQRLCKMVNRGHNAISQQCQGQWQTQQRHRLAATWRAGRQNSGASVAGIREQWWHQWECCLQGRAMQGSRFRRWQHNCTWEQPKLLLANASYCASWLLVLTKISPKIEVIKQVRLKAHFLPMISTASPNPSAPSARPALAQAKMVPVSASATFISW